MHANPGVLYSTTTHLNVKHVTLATTNQPFLCQLMLLVPPVKRDCTLTTQQLIVSIMTTLTIASHAQRVVNSPLLPYHARYALVATFKTRSPQMQKNVHRVLLVHLLLMIATILLTTIPSKIVLNVRLEHIVLPVPYSVTDALLGKKRLKIQYQRKQHVFLVKVVVTNRPLEKMIALIVLLEIISQTTVQHFASPVTQDCTNRKKHNQNAKNVQKPISQTSRHN